MGCDQIFELDLLTGSRRLVSTGLGRTTCSYFMPGDEAIVFASTHGAADDCLPSADYSQGYVWKIYPEYDLWVRDLQTWELKPLAHAPGYDAEAVVSPDGERIIFTSRREGDLDLYLMNVDGTGMRKITERKGYDGGAFFAPDSRRIVWRAYYPQSEEEAQRYDALLATDSIEPMALQVYTLDLDAPQAEPIQVTDNGAANFGPYWHPDGQRIIYCSNQDDPTGRDFNLYLVNADGSANERITYCPSFDGFPMFSHDGKRLIFASNRQGEGPGNTNLFLAEWLDNAAPAPPVETEGN
jgi:Tol biopolymer transport system component